MFLNLDSNTIDFKFWMAHELGHALAPTMEWIWALTAFCKAQDNAAAFIHRVLGLPLVDARALAQELRQ